MNITVYLVFYAVDCIYCQYIYVHTSTMFFSTLTIVSRKMQFFYFVHYAGWTLYSIAQSIKSRKQTNIICVIALSFCTYTYTYKLHTFMNWCNSIIIIISMHFNNKHAIVKIPTTTKQILIIYVTYGEVLYARWCWWFY